MSRYTCYGCESEHGTDNMVAYCAACYYRLRAQLAEVTLSRDGLRCAVKDKQDIIDELRERLGDKK